MIQYSANDIVEKALALADLQNSDFLTWKEKITYLNDSFINMYNKAIDYGDNIYTQEIEFTDTEMELPDDFYQLREVYTLNDNVKTLVTPKPMNQSLSSLSYEIINNTIKLYGKYQGKAYFTYYVTPQSLIVSRERKELENLGIVNFDENNASTSRKHNFFYKNLFLANNKIKNLEDSTYEKDVTFDFTDSNLANNYFTFFNNVNAISVNMDSSPSFVCGSVRNTRDLPLCTFEFNNSGYHGLAYFNGSWYLVNDDGNALYNFSLTEEGEILVGRKALDLSFTINHIGDSTDLNVVYFPYDISEDTMIVMGGYSASSMSYSIGNGEVHLIDDYLEKLEHISNFYILPKDKTFKDSIVFITSKNRMFFINNENEEPNLFKELNDDLYLIGISEFNSDTCYGLVCYDFTDQKFYLESAFDTTELNFPNNTYFTLISYQLAILFCNKQGKDNTALRIELEKQENVFYDALHRDETSFRITNVDSFN